MGELAGLGGDTATVQGAARASTRTPTRAGLCARTSLRRASPFANVPHLECDSTPVGGSAGSGEPAHAEVDRSHAERLELRVGEIVFVRAAVGGGR
jgi:hypothetical protein